MRGEHVRKIIAPKIGETGKNRESQIETTVETNAGVGKAEL